MSKNAPYNEPAFPVQDASTWQAHGMTLRDYFAAKALPSIIVIAGAGQHTPRDGMSTDESIAFDAYELADAMLRARAA